MADAGLRGWTLPLPERFRLAPTVHSHGAAEGPGFRWDAGAGTLVRALRIGDPGAAPRPVEIAEVAADRIEIRHGADGARPEEIQTLELAIATPGWEPDEAAAAEVEESVVFMLDLARDLRPFHELCLEDPALERIPEMGAGRLLRCPTLWEELGKAVLAAALPWSRALEAMEAAASLAPAVPDAEGLAAWPTPGEVSEAGRAGIEGSGVPAREAARLVSLARRAAAGELDLAAAQAGALTAHRFRQMLLSVEGLDGPGADRLLILYGHTDRLPLDAATVTFLRDAHFGGRTPTRDEIHARYEAFGRWRGLACWMEVVQALWWPRAGITA